MIFGCSSNNEVQYPRNPNNQYTMSNPIQAKAGVVIGKSDCDTDNAFITGGCWLFNVKEGFVLMQSKQVNNGWFCDGNTGNSLDNETVVVAYATCSE